MTLFNLRDKSVTQILAWINYNGKTGDLDILLNDRRLLRLEFEEGNPIVFATTEKNLTQRLVEIQKYSNSNLELNFTEITKNNGSHKTLDTIQLILSINKIIPCIDKEFIERTKKGWTVIRNTSTYSELNDLETKIIQLSDEKLSLKNIAKELNADLQKITELSYGLYLIGELKLCPLKNTYVPFKNKISLDKSNINNIDFKQNKALSEKEIILIGFSAILISFICLITGYLKPLEFQIANILFKMRKKVVDSPITIVEVTETDIKKIGKYPIPDRILAQAVTEIEKNQPLAIGIDFYRDISIEPGSEVFNEVLEDTSSVIGVYKHQGEYIAPHPVLEKKGNIGFSDLIYDSDLKTKRALISLQKENDINLGFATRLAISYFDHHQHNLERISPTKLSINDRTFHPLTNRSGIYWNQKNIGGFQVLIDYVSPESFVRLSLSDLLAEDYNPEMLEGKLVLIGATAESLKDYMFTPIDATVNQPTPGVYVHAFIAQTLINIANTGRYLRPVNKDIEIIIILGISTLSLIGLQIIYLSKERFLSKVSLLNLLILFLTINIGIIFLSGAIIFIHFNLWLPIGTTGIISTIAAITGFTYLQNQNHNKLFGTSVEGIFNQTYLQLYWKERNFSGSWAEETVSIILYRVNLKQKSLLYKKIKQVIGNQTLVVQIKSDIILVVLPLIALQKAQQLAEKIKAYFPNINFGTASIICPGDIEALIAEAKTKLNRQF